MGGLTAVLLTFALMFAPAADAAVCGNQVRAAAAQVLDEAIATADHGVSASDLAAGAAPDAGET